MPTNDKPIAFFDSGVGGLTVYEKVKKLLPHENYLYFGDLKNIPYGEKSREELIEFADEIFKFFERKGAKAVVMACNTTSAAAYEALKDKYNFKIYPIIQSCASVLAAMPIKRLGILATEATINSGTYAREISAYNADMEVFSHSCPGWVKIVEEKTQDNSLSVALVEEFLGEMLKNKPEKIVLGCTHYPYLLDVLSKFCARDMFIDPSVYFAEFIKQDLAKNGMLCLNEQPFERFYVSANPEEFKKASSMFYQIQDLPELVAAYTTCG